MTAAEYDRFFARVVVSPDSCWLWTGGRTQNGYADMYVTSGTRRGHRRVFEHFNGPVPAGLELDHVCRVRHCVNPDHLEVVTAKENAWRSPIRLSAQSVGRCHRGHALAKHAYWRLDRPGQFVCRACARELRAA